MVKYVFKIIFNIENTLFKGLGIPPVQKIIKMYFKLGHFKAKIYLILYTNKMLLHYPSHARIDYRKKRLISKYLQKRSRYVGDYIYGITFIKPLW